jgi:hypothetical protein
MWQICHIFLSEDVIQLFEMAKEKNFLTKAPVKQTPLKSSSLLGLAPMSLSP